MNEKTQPSERKDGFGAQGVGEDGDGSMGQAGSGAGGTSGQPNRAQPVEGAFGKDEAHGRRSPANKQGLDKGGTAQD